MTRRIEYNPERKDQGLHEYLPEVVLFRQIEKVVCGEDDKMNYLDLKRRVTRFLSQFEPHMPALDLDPEQKYDISEYKAIRNVRRNKQRKFITVMNELDNFEMRSMRSLDDIRESLSEGVEGSLNPYNSFLEATEVYLTLASYGLKTLKFPTHRDIDLLRDALLDAGKKLRDMVIVRNERRN